MTKEEIIEMSEQAGFMFTEHYSPIGFTYSMLEDFAKLIAEKALETKDEPVAWGMEKDGVILDVICPDEHERKEGSYTVPLYTTPQLEEKNT